MFKDILRLEEPKIKEQDLYLWADYIELYCLVSDDHAGAFDEVLRGMSYAGDSLQGEIMPEDETFLGEEAEAEEVGDKEAKLDRLACRIRDLDDIIKYRSSLFGEKYPFIRESGALTLKEELTVEHELYINQLLASNLRLMTNKTLSNSYTAYFEQLSVIVTCCLFPSPFKVRHFGTAHHPGLAGYSGNYAQRMKKLAEDIHSDLMMEDRELRTHSGDGGLDVVAWCDFGDPASHLPVIVVQAGCTAEEDVMTDKSLQIQRLQYCFRHLKMLPFFMTPQCYRDALGRWPLPSRLGGVMIDRYRVLSVLTAPAANHQAALRAELPPAPILLDSLIGA